MKLKPVKRLFAFIVTSLVFSALAEFANAQTCSLQQPCPKGYKCVNGRCKCSCIGHPVPPACAPLCGPVTDKNETGNRSFLVSVLSDSVAKSTIISFSLQQPENIVINIFDAAGILVKTFAEQFFELGEHSMEWNTAEIHEGVYTVRLQSAPVPQTEK